LVSGAIKGKQHTYALLDARVPDLTTPDRDEALAELTRRYYASRGPATLKDYCTWASLTVADARRGVNMLGAEAVPEVIDQRTYWSVPGDGAADRATPPSGPVFDLLQDYDEYVIGYSESRDVILRPDGPTETLTGRLRPLLLDGRLIGFWKHSATTTDVAVRTVRVRPLTADEAVAMQAAADRFGAFLEAPAVTMSQP
jgi:hypothetical protein